jgi:hypothetical protein
LPVDPRQQASAFCWISGIVWWYLRRFVRVNAAIQAIAIAVDCVPFSEASRQELILAHCGGKKVV